MGFALINWHLLLYLINLSSNVHHGNSEWHIDCSMLSQSNASKPDTSDRFVVTGLKTFLPERTFRCKGLKQWEARILLLFSSCQNVT